MWSKEFTNAIKPYARTLHFHCHVPTLLQVFKDINNRYIRRDTLPHRSSSEREENDLHRKLYPPSWKAPQSSRTLLQQSLGAAMANIVSHRTSRAHRQPTSIPSKRKEPARSTAQRARSATKDATERKLRARCQSLDREKHALQRECDRLNRRLTDRELDLSAARKELQVLTRALNSAQEFIVIADARGRTLFVNDATLHLLGFSRKELLSKNISRILSNHMPPSALGNASKPHRASGWTGEVRHKRHNGEETSLELSTRPIIGRIGKLSANITIGRDTTDSLKEREREQELADRYRRAMSMVHTVSYVRKFPAWSFPSISEEIEAITGYSRQELTARKWRNRILPEALQVPPGATGDHQVGYQHLPAEASRR